MVRSTAKEPGSVSSDAEDPRHASSSRPNPSKDQNSYHLRHQEESQQRINEPGVAGTSTRQRAQEQPAQHMFDHDLEKFDDSWDGIDALQPSAPNAPHNSANEATIYSAVPTFNPGDREIGTGGHDPNNMDSSMAAASNASLLDTHDSENREAGKMTNGANSPKNNSTSPEPVSSTLSSVSPEANENPISKKRPRTPAARQLSPSSDTGLNVNKDRRQPSKSLAMESALNQFPSEPVASSSLVTPEESPAKNSDPQRAPFNQEKPTDRPQKRARKSRAVPGNNVFSSISAVHPSSNPFQNLFAQPPSDSQPPPQSTPWKRNDKRGQAMWSQSFVNVTPRDIKGKILRLDNSSDLSSEDLSVPMVVGSGNAHHPSPNHPPPSILQSHTQPYVGDHSPVDSDRNFTWVEYEFVQASTGHCSHSRKPAAETMAAEMLLALSAKP